MRHGRRATPSSSGDREGVTRHGIGTRNGDGMRPAIGGVRRQSRTAMQCEHLARCVAVTCAVVERK